MAKERIKFEIEMDIESEEINRPLRIWLFQFINRLNYEHDVISVKYKDEVVSFNNDEEVRELPLKHHDSLKKRPGRAEK